MVLILCEGVPCVCVCVCVRMCVCHKRGAAPAGCALARWRVGPAGGIGVLAWPQASLGRLDFVLHILPGVNTSPSSAKDMPMLP